MAIFNTGKLSTLNHIAYYNYCTRFYRSFYLTGGVATHGTMIFSAISSIGAPTHGDSKQCVLSKPRPAIPWVPHCIADTFVIAPLATHGRRERAVRWDTASADPILPLGIANILNSVGGIMGVGPRLGVALCCRS